MLKPLHPIKSRINTWYVSIVHPTDSAVAGTSIWSDLKINSQKLTAIEITENKFSFSKNKNKTWKCIWIHLNNYI